MCWIHTFNISRKDLIKEAQTDIECFKVITVRRLKYFDLFYFGRKKIFSYFRNYRYKLNKLYELKKPINIYFSIPEGYRANKGFHSYSSKCSIEYRQADYWFDDSIEIRTEVIGKLIASYSLMSFDGNNRKRQTKIVKCIIPKGSHYAINDVGEIISDRIILKEILKLY